MLEVVNRVFLVLLMLGALLGISISLIALFLPGLLEGDAEYDLLGHMDFRPDFSLVPGTGQLFPEDSPYLLNVTLRTPPLRDGDNVSLDIFSGGKHFYEIDCLEDFKSADEYAGMIEFSCEAAIPYNYDPNSTYRVFGVFVRDGSEYAAGPLTLESDWRGYEQSFLDFSFFMGIGMALVYLVVVVPVLILALKLASGMNHHEEVPGEYSLQSLLFPLRYAKTLLQMFHSFLISPYFWAFESIGIIIILLYMAIAGQAWKSTTATIAFVFSGLAAFVVPFLWSVAWWYADYREREPLRIIVTMFLWGMLSALIVIGINSFADVGLGVAGLAVLGTFLVAPVVEEFSKGSGLTLLSEHHEFNSIEDGFIFGFVIGMGFSFVENWLYFLGNPLGSDTLGWFVLFVLRSVIFSANHGLYTAITGGVMGYFIERKFKAPALALLVGFPVAAFLHAMHNSGGAVISLLGGGGALLYCCVLIPLFDYGGFIVLLLFFIRAVIRQKGR